MRTVGLATTNDLNQVASQSYLVALVDFTFGTLALSDKPGRIGADTLLPIVLNWNAISDTQVSFSVEEQAVPEAVDWWVWRNCQIWRIAPNLTSIQDGELLFKGVVEIEPSSNDLGVLTVVVGPVRLKPVLLPAYAAIDTTTYPLAAPDAIGQIPPWIVGTVEKSNLLPIQLPLYTTLAEPAFAFDISLSVANASAFPAAGTVYIDGISYTYTARNDYVLLGMTISAIHQMGTTVAIAGVSKWLAAGHAVTGISKVSAGTSLTSGYTIDTASAIVTFPTVPLKTILGTVNNVSLEFDAIDASTTAMDGINSIRAAVGSVTQSATLSTIPVDISLVVAYLDGIVGGLTVQQPLSMLLTIPPAVAGTYAFDLTFFDPIDLAYSTHTVVRIGGTSYVMDYTHPSSATLDVVLGVGQTSILITHSVAGGVWPSDWLALGTSLIATINARIISTSGLPPSTTDVAEIVFDHPAPISGTDRIIAGAYTVNFNVVVDPQTLPVGQAYVTIGGQRVWVWNDGTVIYNTSPVTIQFDTDIDRLPISVVTQNMRAGLVLLTCTAANRTVVLGNLDAASYATLRKAGSKTLLSVNQTTNNPNRGSLLKSQLVVEFAALAKTIDTVAVAWDGKALGNLSMTNAAGGDNSQSHNIIVDSSSSGSAKLTNHAVGGISSNPALKSDVKVAQGAIITASMSVLAVGLVKRGMTKSPKMPGYTAPDSITCGFTFERTSTWDGMSGASCTARRADGSVITSIYPGSLGASVGTNLYTYYFIINEVPDRFTFEDYAYSVAENCQYSKSVALEWAAAYTAPALTISGGGYAGSPIVANTTVDARANVNGTGTGALTVTTPGSPRTIINTFPLPFITNWADFTNKTAKLLYTGAGTTDVLIVHMYVAADYLPITYEPVASAGDITATVVGLDGNPAAVLGFIAAAAGENIDVFAQQRLSNWAAGEQFILSHREDNPTDAMALLAEVAAETNVLVAPTAAGLAFIRKLDVTRNARLITVTDIIGDAPPGISWAPPEEIFTEFVMSYAIVNGNKPEKALTRNAETPDYFASLGERQLGGISRRQRSTANAAWIADTVTATRAAKDWLQLHAPMRRIITATVTFAFSDVEIGDMVEFVYNGLDLICLVTSTNIDNAGFITLTLAESVTQGLN